MNNNIIVGISGASGMVYAVSLTEALSLLPEDGGERNNRNLIGRD